MPYNKAVGTIELNNFISEYLDIRDKRVVHEVRAGRFKRYFAEGDKVFYEREEAYITKIERNPNYYGTMTQKESTELNRWGQYRTPQGELGKNDDPFKDLEHLLSTDVNEEERKNSASHIVTVRKIGESAERAISDTGAINELLMGYALTIHKSQGSQWNKVYCIFHNSHNRNLQRESLYTAITRAQKELYVIAEPETFIQGVCSQHIKGNTLDEKAWYFKGKQQEQEKQANAQLDMLKKDMAKVDDATKAIMNKLLQSSKPAVDDSNEDDIPF
jgi:ATP-dependent exoDNAse (exonuclease V) alpha subunit